MTYLFERELRLLLEHNGLKVDASSAITTAVRFAPILRD